MTGMQPTLYFAHESRICRLIVEGVLKGRERTSLAAVCHPDGHDASFYKYLEQLEHDGTDFESAFPGCNAFNGIFYHVLNRQAEHFDRVVAVDAPAVVPTHSIPFSVSIGGDVMEAEIDRSILHDVQLPQAFDTQILRAAHERAVERGETATEDGVLVFRAGHEVRFVEGLPRNLKVTYPVDLVIVESLLAQQ